MSVRIDSKSGAKVFATCAAKASEKIAGKGYSTVSDEALKNLAAATRRCGLRCGRASEVSGIQRGACRCCELHVHVGGI